VKAGRRICSLTGSRADYGLLFYVWKAIQEEPGLELQRVITGMHLSPQFAAALKEVEGDGFPVSARVDLEWHGDAAADAARAAGRGILGLVDAFRGLRPEIVLVLGDRVEMFAAAAAAALMGLPLAHLHGGEVTGGVDESLRHSISKLAHLHLAATELSAERLRRMGEEPWRIHVVGAPGLDYIRQLRPLTKEEMARELELDPARPVIIATLHPVLSELELIEWQGREFMEALVSCGEQVVVTYPNLDPGGRRLASVVEEYRGRAGIRIAVNLGQPVYLSLLRWAAAMVGNSSSGLLEAPSFGLPVVNIGSRQQGRERAENVMDVGHGREEILAGLGRALREEEFRQRARACRNPYGDGKSGPRIARLLREAPLGRELLQKRMTY
jgi:UDP-N-acetylglucosamine 2-epimerase (non-hydrolysing)/GDP/UDP-N,N'-diacetylbacillosamine 2-epimerase (hydrolysing)